MLPILWKHYPITELILIYMTFNILYSFIVLSWVLLKNNTKYLSSMDMNPNIIILLIFFKQNELVHIWVLNRYEKYSLKVWVKQWNMKFLLFGLSVASNSLQPNGLQHTRLPCPSLSPRVCSNSCLLSRWCHPIISSSVIPFYVYFNFILCIWSVF